MFPATSTKPRASLALTGSCRHQHKLRAASNLAFSGSPLALASFTVCCGAMVADQRLSVGLRQPVSLPATHREPAGDAPDAFAAIAAT
jgi:hypothetical protein